MPSRGDPNKTLTSRDPNKTLTGRALQNIYTARRGHGGIRRRARRMCALVYFCAKIHFAPYGSIYSST